MNSGHLNSLMILSYEKDIVDELDIDSVVKEQSSTKQRIIKIVIYT